MTQEKAVILGAEYFEDMEEHPQQKSSCQYLACSRNQRKGVNEGEAGWREVGEASWSRFALGQARILDVITNLIESFWRACNQGSGLCCEDPSGQNPSCRMDYGGQERKKGNL